MPKHLIIRNATNEDVGSLVELAASSFRDTYLLLDDPVDIEEYITTKFTPAIFASVLKDDLSTLLVAIDDEQYVGYSHIVLSTPPPCVTGPSPIELARLYLRQAQSAKGTVRRSCGRYIAWRRIATARQSGLVSMAATNGHVTSTGAGASRTWEPRRLCLAGVATTIP